MSSKAMGRKYRVFCNHMREAIIDERKASPDYAKLIRQGSQFAFAKELEDVVHPILMDERGHKKKLTKLYHKVCKLR